MYVAVKGGEKAIANALALLAEERRGDTAQPELSLEQIKEQLTLSVHRVMTEGSLYDPDLAALAIKQARGDLIEAIHLLRAYRTTLPRLGATEPLDTGSMLVQRRISATFKDLPGGQVLGATFDYTHRLLDFDLAHGGPANGHGNGTGNGAHPGQADRGPDAMPPGPTDRAAPDEKPAMPRVVELLDTEGLVEREVADPEEREAGDLTRDPLAFPLPRDVRLQNLARGDEGFLLALGYSTQRGFGNSHPFAGEIRAGTVTVEIVPEELGFPIEIAEIAVTECQMINQFRGSHSAPPQFTRGYGLVFGNSERKAMAMALVDRALRCRELGEPANAPAQDEEFVMYHSDNVEASGFVQHLKLPHYVDFQAELELVRRMRSQQADPTSTPIEGAGKASHKRNGETP